MAVTIQQIAEATGVSRGTVDRALNDRGRIDPAVAEKIRQTASELGYVKKERKKRAQVQKRKMGIITQLSGADFMQSVHAGIVTAKKELEELGFEVLVCENDSVEEKDQLRSIEMLEKEGIQGLAIMPVDAEKVRRKLNVLSVGRQIPVVTFNSDIVGTGRCCFVGMDNKKSGYAAAGLFEMLTRGTGKILIITGYFSSVVNNARVDGFVQMLKERVPALEIAGVQASFNREEEVERIIENAMMSISGISGIFEVSGGQKGIGRAFEKLRIEHRPYVVIYDETPDNAALLINGTADFLIDQNGFEQGYRPPRILADMLMNGTQPEAEFLYTGIDIKTKYNI